MSNTRRGTLAVALVTAVVGSTGLVWTLNAGAEQIPEPTESTVATTDPTAAISPSFPAGPADPSSPAGPADADTDPLLSPPPRLPWGKKPSEIQTGDDGSSSESLTSEGLDAAAPAETTTETDAENAPKGRSTRNGFLSSTPAEVVPPKPPAVAAAAALNPTVHFLYNVGSQAAATDGAYANFTIDKPYLATADYHSLAELAVQSADGNQIVEIGWNVDRVVNGDSDPHLFVFHWVNGQPACYNGCGFVQYSENISPGDTLPEDAVKKMGVQYYNGAWWLAYDTEWVGYFPGTQWNNTFTRTGMVQVFGEVAAATTSPCTEMGNGLNGASDISSARISSVSYVNGPAVQLYIRSTSNHYDVDPLSARTFRYGGQGPC